MGVNAERSHGLESSWPQYRQTTAPPMARRLVAASLAAASVIGIGLLLEAVRVAGVYDGSQKDEISQVMDITRLVSGGELKNILIPIKDWGRFTEKGGLKGAIDWVPLDVIVAALKTRSPQVVSSVAADWIATTAPDSPYGHAVRALDPGSVVVAPLVAGSEVLGGMQHAPWRGRRQRIHEAGVSSSRFGNPTGTSAEPVATTPERTR